jgi:hypothetical protein
MPWRHSPFPVVTVLGTGREGKPKKAMDRIGKTLVGGAKNFLIFYTAGLRDTLGRLTLEKSRFLPLVGMTILFF